MRGELDSAIDSYVPMKKQGKWSKKKHLSKEAFRKYKDYDAYKEALNAAQQTKLEILSEIFSTNYHKILNQTVRVSMCM